MREILFRGKIINNHSIHLKPDKGWVYGVPVPIKINSYATDRVEMTECHGYDELDYYELLSEDEEVDPKTIGQYTGLKDKNGKMIFEGDVVRLYCGIYGTYEMCVIDIRNGFKPIEEKKIKEIEIIGNIYDNPELA